MSQFSIYCKTCSYEHQTGSLEDALEIEESHKAQHGEGHEVMIERIH